MTKKQILIEGGILSDFSSEDLKKLLDEIPGIAVARLLSTASKPGSDPEFESRFTDKMIQIETQDLPLDELDKLIRSLRFCSKLGFCNQSVLSLLAEGKIK